MTGVTASILKKESYLGKFLRFFPIGINNWFVRQRIKNLQPDEMLILLPRCLQHTSCSQNVVESLTNCRRCGRCPTGDVAALAEKYHIPAALATGSLMARHLVKKWKPRLILAVACERELIQGILSVFPRSVFALYNERPNGPCKDTYVDPRHVEEKIRFFLAEKRV